MKIKKSLLDFNDDDSACAQFMVGFRALRDKVYGPPNKSFRKLVGSVPVSLAGGLSQARARLSSLALAWGSHQASSS